MEISARRKRVYCCGRMANGKKCGSRRAQRAMFTCKECNQTFCSAACCSYHVETAMLCGQLAFPGGFAYDKAYAGAYDPRLKQQSRVREGDMGVVGEEQGGMGMEVMGEMEAAEEQQNAATVAAAAAAQEDEAAGACAADLQQRLDAMAAQLEQQTAAAAAAAEAATAAATAAAAAAAEAAIFRDPMVQTGPEPRYVAAALKGIMTHEDWSTKAATFSDAIDISAAFNMTGCKECRLQQSFVTYLPHDSVDPRECVCRACVERQGDRYATYVPYSLISPKEQQQVVRLLDWDARQPPFAIIWHVQPATSSKLFVPYDDESGSFVISKAEFVQELGYLDAADSIIDDLPAGYNTPEEYLLSTWDLALEAKRGKRYIRFNPRVSSDLAIRGKSRWFRLIERLRADEWGKDLLRGSTDILHSTLVLVGDSAKGTRWHIDWMQAVNVAWLLDKGRVNLDKPAAVWFFVPPEHIEAFNAFLGGDSATSVFNVYPLQTIAKTRDMLQQFRDQVGDQGAVICVEQFAGQVVYVPPGWLHAVINAQPCLKMAWDHQVAENLPLYVESWRRHSMFKVADDYSGLMSMLLEWVKQNLM